MRFVANKKSGGGSALPGLHPHGMIYLIFDCISANREVTFNEEFQEIAWVRPASLQDLDLNEATRMTFAQKGLL